jgi:hypothetical protein
MRIDAMTTETYDRETLTAIMAEARRQGFDNATIADKLNLPLADVVRIEGENKMADLITMENFLNTKKELAVMAEVAAKFIDETRHTLKGARAQDQFFTTASVICGSIPAIQSTGISGSNMKPPCCWKLLT